MRIHLQPRQKKTLGVLVVGGIIVCTLCAVGTTYVGIRRHAFVSYPESAYQQTSFSSGSTDILAVVPQANIPTAQSVYKGAVSPSRSVSMSPSVSSGALVTMSDKTMQSYGGAYGGAYGGTIQGGVSARQQTDAVYASGSVSVPSIPTIAYRGSVRDRYGLAGVAVSTDGRAVIRRLGDKPGGSDTPPIIYTPVGDELLPLLLMIIGWIGWRQRKRILASQASNNHKES